MEFALGTAVVASAIAMAVISASFLYLYIIFREAKELAFWGAAFFFIFLDYLMVLIVPGVGSSVMLPLWEGVHGAFVVLLFVGVRLFLNLPIPIKLLTGLWLVVVAWGALGLFVSFSHLVQTLPASLISGGLVISAGIALLRIYPQRKGPGYFFSGISCVVWGTHRLDYSIIDRFPDLLPAAYMLALTFALSMGIGLILSSLEFNRRRALASAKDAEAGREGVISILEAIPSAVVVSNPLNGDILFANSKFSNLLGEEKPNEESWRGKVLNRILPPVDLQFDLGKESALAGVEGLSLEYRVTRPNGDLIWISNSQQTIDWYGSRARQNTLQNITHRKQIEKSLQDAKVKAEMASVASSKFLAAASHDLRQPLQSASLFLSTLELGMNKLSPTGGTISSKENLYVLVRAQKSLESLGDLLQSLLDISRLDVGSIAPEYSTVCIGDLLKEVEVELTTLAWEKGLSLRYVPSSLYVRTDKILLKRILNNLIANAIKYTPKGKVLFGCRRKKNTLIVEIWDTGIGIAENNLEAIFKEFYQVSNPARQRKLGFGLGLSIVKKLADLIDAEISVCSQLGKGSVFSLELPLSEKSLESSSVKVVPNYTPTTPGQRTILIVDDDAEVLEATRSLVKAWGFYPLTAVDSTDAHKVLSTDAYRIDLAIVDYQLPSEMNGISLADDILRVTGARAKIIIVSGETSSEFSKKIDETNYRYLPKPVDGNTLRNAVDDLLAN